MRALVIRSAAALLVLGPLAACDIPPPPQYSDDPYITDLVLTLTNDSDPTDVLALVASDPDADGVGIAFAPEALQLTAGVTYTGTLRLHDAINNVDVTEEIEEDPEEHLFHYSFQPASGGTVTLLDRESDYTGEDTNNGDFAVGLRFTLASGARGSGTLTAALYHFGDAPKTSSTATSDEIDMDLAIPIEIR